MFANPESEYIFWCVITVFVSGYVAYICSIVDQRKNDIAWTRIQPLQPPSRQALLVVYLICVSSLTMACISFLIISASIVDNSQAKEKATQLAQIHATQTYVQSFLPTIPPISATQTAAIGTRNSLSATEQVLVYGQPTETPAPTPKPGKDDGTGILIIACAFGWICH